MFQTILYLTNYLIVNKLFFYLNFVFAVNLAAVVCVFTFISYKFLAIEGRAMAKVVPTVNDIEQINNVLAT